MHNENGNRQTTLAAAPTVNPMPSESDDFTPRYLDASELTFTTFRGGNGTSGNSERGVLSTCGGAAAYAAQQT